MRLFVLALLLALLAPVAAAQPKDGDVVLTFAHDYNSLFDQGRVIYFHPANPSVLHTLAVNSAPSFFHSCVRMAPGNRDLVVGEQSADFLSSRLMQITPTGAVATITTLSGDLEGFDLDGDDTWIANGAASVYGVHHSTSLVTSFFAPTTLTLGFSDVAIVREGGFHYAVANFTDSSLLAPKLFGASRTGITSTLVSNVANPLAQLSALALDPRKGDLITTDYDGPPQEPSGAEVNRVTLGGQVSTLYGLLGANAVKVDGSDTIWVAGFAGSTSTLVFENTLVRMDLSTQTVVTIYQFPQMPATRWSITGVEIYGSRMVTCNGTGGSLSTVRITVRSQHMLAPGSNYAVALSFSRRPNVQMPNGEWLCLDVTDPFFTLTVQNQVPALFHAFSGILDGSGGAQAEVRLPSGFPSNLGLTVFCAAVVYDTTGIIQVSNTHWFEL